MTQCDGVIFDLDGTLVDSLLDITAALNHALAQEGRPALDARVVRDLIGEGLVRLCQRACPEADAAAVARLASTTERYYRKHYAVHTRPYPKIMSTLELLNGAGLRLAVLSNKPHALTVATLEATRLAGYLGIVRGCASESDRKPSPAAALEIARHWGIEPPGVALVGDSEVDVATARNAGMRSIAVTWGYRDRDVLVRAGPDALVDDPEKIFSALRPPG